MPHEQTSERDERMERRVRETCKQIRIEAPTPGATAAWNDVLVPHLVRQRLMAEEQAHGRD